MKNLIMVIDDEWRQRKKGYDLLRRALAARAPELGIELHIAESPEQILPMSRRDRYRGAIVDAVLDANWPTCNIEQALADLGTAVPFAVLSAHWDKTNARQIDEALKRPKWRAFLHWRDIDPAGGGQIDYAVRALLRMIYDELQISGVVDLKADEPIRLVHISDIQTGGADTKNLRLEANSCADRILTHWGNRPPAFVAFTGDVAEHGTPTQYKAAREWIAYFFEHLGLGELPSDCLLYVPGNHDVNVSLGGASRIRYGAGKGARARTLKLVPEIVHPDLVSYAYAPFRRYLGNICRRPFLSDDPDDQSFAWIETRFRHLGVIFYGVNTAQPPSAFGLPGREVSADALAQIRVELNKVKGSSVGPKPIVVGLGHHSPAPASGDDGVSNPEAFEIFFRSATRTAVFLHGHTHDHKLEYSNNNGLRMVRSCATTLTKSESARPPDSLRGFNLLQFDREDSQVTALQAWSFGWSGRDLLKLPSSPRWQLQRDGMFRDQDPL